MQEKLKEPGDEKDKFEIGAEQAPAKRSYYYDDAHGYEVYREDCDKDDEIDEPSEGEAA